MIRIVSFRPALLIAAMASLFTPMHLNARAADLDDAIAAEAGITPVEYGSGWYLRGDIGAFHGSGQASYAGGSADFSGAGFGDDLALGAGIGYIFNERMRADLTVSHHGTFGLGGASSPGACGGAFTGECFTDVSAAIAFTTAQINAYYTLTPQAGLKPYVGAGLGLAGVRWDDYSSQGYCVLDPGETCNGATHSGGPGQEILAAGSPATSHGSSTLVAVSLMAGLDYELNEYWTLDMGYKFTGLYDFGFGDASSSAEIDSVLIHELRVGLRYEIW